MSGAIRITYDLISLGPISAIYTRTILIIYSQNLRNCYPEKCKINFKRFERHSQWHSRIYSIMNTPQEVEWTATVGEFSILHDDLRAGIACHAPTATAQHARGEMFSRRIIARTGIDFGGISCDSPVTQFSVPSDIRNRGTRPFDPGKLRHSVYTTIATPRSKPEPGRIDIRQTRNTEY